MRACQPVPMLGPRRIVCVGRDVHRLDEPISQGHSLDWVGNVHGRSRDEGGCLRDSLAIA